MLHHVIVGDGKPILILHGSTLDHHHMMESLEPLFRTMDGWRRIYADMPGHGKSPPQDNINSQDDLLAAVMNFAAEILPDGKFGLIGESRGSYIARGFTHLIPNRVSGVALIVPGGSPSADPGRIPEHEVKEPDPSMLPELSDDELAYFENMMVVQQHAILDKWRRIKAPAKKLWSADQEDRVGAAFDFSFHGRGETSVFEGPSLIIAGRQDRMSGYLDSVDLLPQFPRSTLAVLDSAGHGLAWERPDVFDALIRDWLVRLANSY
jgi:pimeloyl-ACP methyl ester carboxylesterase